MGRQLPVTAALHPVGVAAEAGVEAGAGAGVRTAGTVDAGVRSRDSYTGHRRMPSEVDPIACWISPGEKTMGTCCGTILRTKNKLVRAGIWTKEMQDACENVVMRSLDQI